MYFKSLNRCIFGISSSRVYLQFHFLHRHLAYFINSSGKMIHNSSGNWYTRCILTVTDDTCREVGGIRGIVCHAWRSRFFGITTASAYSYFSIQAPDWNLLKRQDRKWLALACDGGKYTMKECGFFVKTTWWNVRRHFSGSTRLQWLMHLSCACKSGPYIDK